MLSSAFHSSVYCAMNMLCSVLNSGPVTFQWKLCVIRYRVYESASSLDSSPVMAARSLSEMPILIRGAALLFLVGFAM
ncbi:Uncharacterised protein [Bordetella pertussis]|nr:Uncharacterised protein [Bordetella pertussis]CFO76037.1 Uncharacterised protein [Bordetella pertussis]CFP59119.1 Uncharacterised protein [Bordetella pertussis]CFU84944.1 Uncharacterised protein [Bordetella pertussis]CPI22948.1 Uncharacterised protein [Bordetella pertussis]